MGRTKAINLKEVPRSLYEQLLKGLEIVESGCWEWTGFRDKRGYGRIQCGRRSLLTHRVAFSFHTRQLEDGEILDHICNNPPCCNPYHLRVLSNRENLLRGTNPCAVNARREKCVRGHVFDEQNTYIRPDGHRMCRACRNLRSREHYYRSKAGV